MSLAKREEEIFLEGREDSILLPRRDPALRLVQQVRDEAHRFAIKHHRAARAKRTFQSSLTTIPGVGPTTAKRLLQQFGSLEGVREAGDEALAAAVGPARAAKIRAALAGAQTRRAAETPRARRPSRRPVGAKTVPSPVSGARA